MNSHLLKHPLTHMLTLVTHNRPHLDDITALWLFRRYDPVAKDAAIEFVPTNDAGAETPERILIGVGRGKFDEHKGDIGDCATTLVWKDIIARNALDDRERRAVQKIVDYVFLEDTGKLFDEPRRELSIPAMLGGYFDGHGQDSHQQTAFGFDLLDAVAVSMRNTVHVEDIWSKRTEFDSRFGRGVALSGTARQLEPFAYAQGFALVLVTNDPNTYQTIRAKGNSDVDLTSVNDALKTADPQAEWYFHHSKKMLICGGDHAPHARTSSLSPEQLIALLR